MPKDGPVIIIEGAHVQLDEEGGFNSRREVDNEEGSLFV
jgi:hypothetical protein